MKKRTQSSSKGVSYVSRNFVKLCLLWIFSLSSLMIQAQDNQRISVDLRGESLESTLWYLQNRTKFIFMYATEDIANITDISVRAKNKTITEILDECLEGTNLTYEVSGTAIVIKKRKTNKITISGWIRDASGEALPGATVTVRGSKHGAIAGLDGHYTFNIPAQEGLILTYSFIGMEKKTVRYTGKKTINVTLNSSSTEIDEVVVTGYQNIQRRDLVGSITTVKAKDILMPSYTTIDQMLQGRVAGMIVTNTSSRVGTAPKIQIRGTSTLLGNQDPLWVVDGIIQEDPLELNASSLMTEDLKNIIGNQISWLNPADIESISILKDASATAIYLFYHCIEFLGCFIKIIHAFRLTLTHCAGRCGNGEADVVVFFKQSVCNSAFADAGRAGNDDQHAAFFHHSVCTLFISFDALVQTAHSTAAELRNECRNSVLGLFEVLHLFAHLLKLGFAVDNKRRNCFIVRF